MSIVDELALFETWAPPGARWSPWAKPVLFSHASNIIAADPPDSANLPDAVTVQTSLTHLRDADGHSAVIIELPGVAAVRAGLALAQRGYQPVPLFNTTPGLKDVVDATGIIRALVHAADELRSITLPVDAPPAFLLDSRRCSQKRPEAGRYDNRWVIFPQDFPSGDFLRASGVEDVVLMQITSAPPQDDLRDVLIRYQTAGLRLLQLCIDQPARPEPLELPRYRPWRWLRVFAIMALGLRANSAGGFGSVVPQPSSG